MVFARYWSIFVRHPLVYCSYSLLCHVFLHPAGGHRLYLSTYRSVCVSNVLELCDIDGRKLSVWHLPLCLTFKWCTLYFSWLEEVIYRYLMRQNSSVPQLPAECHLWVSFSVFRYRKMFILHLLVFRPVAGWCRRGGGHFSRVVQHRKALWEFLYLVSCCLPFSRFERRHWRFQKLEYSNRTRLESLLCDLSADISCGQTFGGDHLPII